MPAKTFDAVNIDDIKLAPPKASKAAGSCKTSVIQTTSGKRLAIQTPLMTLPWDAVPKRMDESTDFKANVCLSFANMEEGNEECDIYKFKCFLEKFDQKIKSLCVASSAALGKKAEEKVIDVNFKESIKESAKGDYPSTFQPKAWLSVREGGSPKVFEDVTMDVTVFDMNGNKIGSDQLKKGSPCALIVEPSYVWCSALGLGITWTVKQAITRPDTKEEFGFVFDKKMEDMKDSEPPSKKMKTSPEHEEFDEEFEVEEASSETSDF